MKSDVFGQLSGMAETQYGLITTRQLKEVITKDQIRHWGERGLLRRVAPTVYALPGSTPSWRQRAMAACLSCGPPVVLSGCAAARLWELDGVLAPTIEVTVPPFRSGRVNYATVRRRVLEPEDMASHQGIPVTTVGRTLIDLAGNAPIGVVSGALDDALRRRLLAADELDRQLVRGTHARRVGMGALRALVRLRLTESGTADSVWEDRIFRWLVEAGLPAPVRQHQVIVAGLPRTLDLAYPAERVAIEFQGFRYHALGRSRFDDDLARTTELSLAGWIVVLLSSGTGRSDAVDRVIRALRLAGRADRLRVDPVGARSGVP